MPSNSQMEQPSTSPNYPETNNLTGRRPKESEYGKRATTAALVDRLVIPYAELQYGFQYGSAKVTRLFSDEAKGWITLGIETPKQTIQVYVTKTGKSGRREMTIVERLQQSVCDDELQYVNLHFARAEFDELLKRVERAEGAERGLLLLCETLMFGKKKDEPPTDDDSVQFAQKTTVLGYVID